MARLFSSKQSFAWPDADIKENDNEYIFSFEIPGTLKDDIKIWLDDDVLTVSGEKRMKPGGDETVLVNERAFGKFERSFRLPSPVDRNKIKAEFVDGILVVVTPKAAETVKKEIKIN